MTWYWIVILTILAMWTINSISRVCGFSTRLDNFFVYGIFYSWVKALLTYRTVRLGWKLFAKSSGISFWEYLDGKRPPASAPKGEYRI